MTRLENGAHLKQTAIKTETQTSRKKAVKFFFNIMVFFAYQQTCGSAYISSTYEGLLITIVIKKIIKELITNESIINVLTRASKLGWPRRLFCFGYIANTMHFVVLSCEQGRGLNLWIWDIILWRLQSFVV